MTTLRSRLTCWYAVVVMFTVVAAMTIGYLLLRRELIHGVDLLNLAEFREIQDRTEAANQQLSEADFLQQVAAHAEIDAPLYFFQVRRSTGQILFRSPNMGSAVLEANPRGQKNRTASNRALGLVRVGHYREGEFDVQIASSLGSIQRFSSYYLQTGFVISAVALALSIFFGRGLSRLALDPVRRIQQTARRIGANNLSARIPGGTGNDEIASLVRLLNQMFDRLEKSFGRLWRFAGDASHELKTPLSIIRLQSEKLLFHSDLAAAQREVIQQQLESIDRLDSVVEKLLFLAKSEAGNTLRNCKEHQTREFIDDFREDAQVLCEDQGIFFTVVQNNAGEVVFDSALIRQLLLNILTNALRVSPRGAEITLQSSRKGRRWRVVVEDSGPGVPVEELDRIFEPFARVNHGSVAEGSDETGTGLGLAICRSIVELHQGGIRAENRQPGPGLRVWFELPVALSHDLQAGERAPHSSLEYAEAEAFLTSNEPK